MVEAQQTVVMIPLFSINIPPSSATLIAKFMEIATFDIIPVTWIWEKIFFLAPYETLSMRYATVGIEHSGLINNIGSIFLTVIAVVILFALASVLQRGLKKFKKIKSFRRYVHAEAFWRFPLTLFLEGY